MLGYVVLIAFMMLGIFQATRLFKRQTQLTRFWLGSVMGLMEMMWLPSLFAFAFSFTMKAQLYALGTSLFFTLLCVLWPQKRDIHTEEETEDPKTLVIVALMVPAVLLAAFLQYTHTIREIDGALYSGQSTYGDLCMHLSFATGLVGQAYPPEYTLLLGTTLGYPFLVDALSSTMLIFGTPLAPAFYVPGTLMIALIDLGLILFSWKLSHRNSVVILTFVLFLFNGGLGFWQTGTDEMSLKVSLFEYYRTPTNQPDLNLRWVNALCDLLIPQRTLMAGWMCVLPALYLLVCAMQSRRLTDFAGLGLWAGPMVMIHTHSFLALGVISLGALLMSVIRSRGKRMSVLVCFGLYGLIACALALPQLLEWIFPQTIQGGSMRILFNWVNNDGNGGLIEPYYHFWIKNVGPVYVFFFVAGFATRKQTHKALALGSLLLYVLAEFVVFQPNVYDNNKLFYVAFLTMLPLAADVIVNIYECMKNIHGCIFLAIFFVVSSTLTGGITIARECVSGLKGYNYQLFSASQTQAAEFICANTPEDAVFLTANNHNNAVSSLCGRRILCGSSLYLYFHGLDYRQNETDAAVMLAYPEECAEKFERYGVDYIFVSSYERAEIRVGTSLVDADVPLRSGYCADEEKIAELYPLVYEGGEWYDVIRIYAVSERAIRSIK